MTTDWLEDRERNPPSARARSATTGGSSTRYLLPFFGELCPTEITKLKIRQYRQRIHVENEQIRKAAEASTPLRDPRTCQRLRTLGNESINKTIGTLAMILDDAEDADWIARNRRMREPRQAEHPSVVCSTLTRPSVCSRPPTTWIANAIRQRRSTERHKLAGFATTPS